MPVIDDTTVLVTGSTTRRALERRFDQVINVKDFGAQGQGSIERAQIQSAIDSVASGSRGVIFFPAGTYQLDGPLIFGQATNANIIFRGVGVASKITGTFAGFLIDRSADTTPSLVNANPAVCAIEDLSFANFSTDPQSGCVRWMLSYNLAITNCDFSGFNGVRHDGFGLFMTNCDFNHTNVHPTSVGVYSFSGAEAVIANCNFMGWGDGIRLGRPASIHCCRFEDNANGINVGTYENGTGIGTSGVTIMSCGFEANDVGIYCNNMLNSVVSACTIHGHTAAFYSGYGADGTGPLPGADTPPEMVSTYGIFVRNAWNNVFMGCKPFDMFNVAPIHIVDGAKGPNVWIGCDATHGHDTGAPFTGSTLTWDIGGTSHKGQTFINCIPKIDPVMTFAALPTTTGSYATGDVGRSKGSKFFITDGTGALGATVSGGGSTFMEVMWNGTDWIRCA